jgi:flagellar motor switch protein FliM
MIEPFREQLDAGIQSDRGGRDERFICSLKEQIKDAEIEIGSVLAKPQLTLGQLLNLKPGDVIPIDMPRSVDLCVDNLPIFSGSFGVSNGQNAVKIIRSLRATPPAQIH